MVAILTLGQLLILGQVLSFGSSLTWVKLTRVKFDLGQVDTGQVVKRQVWSESSFRVSCDFLFDNNLLIFSYLSLWFSWHLKSTL